MSSFSPNQLRRRLWKAGPMVLLCLLVLYGGGCGVVRFPIPSQFQPKDPHLPENELAELQQEVAKHRQELQQAVQAAANLADAHTLLALAYLNHNMYGEALKSLEMAIAIEPENEVLFYLGGLSTANFALALIPPLEQQQLLVQAERYYLRAIELLPNYSDALYALSALYLFELETPQQALPHLIHLAEIERNSSRAHILLGRAYVTIGQLELALQHYRTAEELATTDDERAELIAIQNRLRGEAGP